MTTCNVAPLKASSQQDRSGISAGPRLLLGRIPSWLLVTVLVILVAPLFPPSPVLVAEWFDGSLVMPLKYMRLVSLAVSVVCFLFFARKRDAFAALTVLFALGALAATVINHGAKDTWLWNWTLVVPAVLFVASFLRERPKELLWAFFLVLFAMGAANLVSMLRHPGGIIATSSYFYGNRNMAFQLAFASLACSLLLDDLAGKRCTARTILCLCVGLGQVIAGASATSTLAFALVIGLGIAVQWKRPRAPLNALVYAVVSVASFFLIVVLRVQNIVAEALAQVLHRNVLTMSGRTDIWDLALGLMRDGYLFTGYGASGRRVLVVNGAKFSHAHNMYLDAWFQAGLIGLLCMLALIGLTVFCLYKMRQNRTCALLAAVVAGYFFVGITETLTCASFLFVLAIGFYWCRDGLGPLARRCSCKSAEGLPAHARE